MVLNGSDEDVDELKKIMEKRRLQAKLDKVYMNIVVERHKKLFNTL